MEAAPARIVWIYKAGLKYLVGQATVVATERVFSTVGDIVYLISLYLISIWLS